MPGRKPDADRRREHHRHQLRGVLAHQQRRRLPVQHRATRTTWCTAVAESSMREVIGRTPIQPALTQLRAQIETDVLQADPADPRPLRCRHRDHPGAAAEGRSAGRGDRKLPRRAARQHRRRAHAQRGRGLPQRHRAARPRRRGPHRRRGPGRQAGLGRAGHRPGAAFDAVLKAYQAAKDVTLRRMYLDTMQDILSIRSRWWWTTS